MRVSTAADLDRLQALTNDTIGPPWAVAGDFATMAFEVVSEGQSPAFPVGCFNEPGDARFVAVAREAVPELVMLVRDLAAALAARDDGERACPSCHAGPEEIHAAGCIVARARALAG